MRSGELVSCGTPDDVLQEELLSSVFDCKLAILRHATLDHPFVVPRR